MYVFIISLSSFNYIYKIPGPLPRLPLLLVLNLALPWPLLIILTRFIVLFSGYSLSYRSEGELIDITKPLFRSTYRLPTSSAVSLLFQFAVLSYYFRWIWVWINPTVKVVGIICEALHSYRKIIVLFNWILIDTESSRSPADVWGELCHQIGRLQMWNEWIYESLCCTVRLAM